ncbi:MAG: hypothetical protein VX527_00640 [Planctomycetota bacterium]|nr:hypothetical protein [Planctomycetota bacterium]
MPVPTAKLLILVIILPGILLGSWLQTAHGADPPNANSAFRHLKRTVTPQRDDSHLTRLTALRSLGDPTLEQLFLRLIQHDSWQIQVYAVLGLAELSEDGRVMPWLVTQINPAARDQVLAIAMDEQRLGPDEIRELTEWKGLQEANRVALLAYSLELGQPVRIEDVRPMTESTNEKVAAAAWLVMAWLGDQTALDHIDAMIQDLPETRQFDILLTIIMLINRYEIAEAADWLDQTLTKAREQNRFREMSLAGTSTLLILDSDRGLKHWRLEFGENPNRRNQITAALMLLQVGVALQTEDRSRLDVDDELIGSIVEAANAVAHDRGDTPQRLIELVDLNHVRSTTMIPGVIEALPPDQATVVLERFLDRMESESFTSVDQMLAIDATERLLELDGNAVLERLKVVKDDSPLQEAMLYGLLHKRNSNVLETVESLHQIGLSRPDALTLLLIARDSDSLDENQLRRLGLITSGGVLVEPLQVQAAWLYLKHTDTLEDAMTRLVPEGS